MFAYCGNNPVNYSDPSGCFRLPAGKFIPFSEDEEHYYIYDQHDPSVSSIQFGEGTVGPNGCAAVASYNALLDMGEYMPFEEVCNWYSEHVSIFDCYGKNGAILPIVKLFFDELGYDTIALISFFPEEHLYYAQTADACIMLYRYKTSSGGRNGHYVAYCQNGMGFLGRNTVGGTATFDSPWVYGAQEHGYFVYEIFIYKKE